MSAGNACTCTGSKEKRMKRWVVRVLRGNRSAFNGYRWTPSDYSEISCDGCGQRWRTKASYVDQLPHRPWNGVDGSGQPITTETDEPLPYTIGL